MKEWLPATLRTTGTEKRLTAGETLFRSGDQTTNLYEITSGKVRLARVDLSGREIILHIAEAGDTIAEASLFSPTYHCDAVAMTNAVVRLYPKTGVLAAFERDPKAAQAFMAMLAQQVMTLRTRLERRNIHSARDRIRHFIALNTDTDGKSVVLRGTLKDLANELGLSHEALYRTLADMAADGEIYRRNGKLTLA